MNLRTPATQTWPRIQLMVLSVLEEDSSDGLDEWHQIMLSLSEEVVHGALQAELEEATADLVGEVKEAALDAIAEFIGQSAKAITGSFVAYALAHTALLIN